MVASTSLAEVEVTFCHLKNSERNVIKMIEITLPMQQDKAIALLENYNEEDVTFTFKEKKGIKLYFETSESDLDKAAKLAKAAIKAETWGSVLYFQVAPVK